MASAIDNALKLAKSFGKSVYEAPKTFGEGLNHFIYAKQNNRDRELRDTIAMESQQRFNQRAIAAKRAGNDELANQFFKKAREASQRIGSGSNPIEDVRKARRKVIGGGTRSALSLGGLSAAPAAIAANLGIGGGLGAAQSALSGDDLATGIGSGAGDSLKFAGLNRVTAPLFNPVVNSFSNRLGTFAGRSIAGAGTNLAEDEAYTRLSEGRGQTGSERLFSLGLGAIGGQFGDRKTEAFEVVDGKKPEKLRDVKGRFAKEATEKLKKTANSIKGKFIDEIDTKGGSKRLVQVGDRKFRMEDAELEGAFGGVVGFEFETDEEGKVTNVNFDPKKALLGAGVGLTGSTIARSKLTGKQLSTPSKVLEQAREARLGREATQGLSEALQSARKNQATLSLPIRTRQKIQLPQNLEKIGATEPHLLPKGTHLTAQERESLKHIVTPDPGNPAKKVNIIDYLRTPTKVLEKIGLGREAKILQKSYDQYRLDLKDEIGKITDWYKQAPGEESARNIFKFLDGQDVQLKPNEQKVANEIRPYLKTWADKLGLPEDARVTHYITHIFEDDLIQKEFDPELAKLITDKIPGSVYDPFLQERLGAQGYVEDVWKALDAYVKRGTRKFNMDPALRELEKSSNKLDVESWKYVQKLSSRINLRPTETDTLIDNFIKSTPIGYKLGQRPTAKVSRKLRNVIYRGALGLNVGSAVRNLTQGVNTYAKLGEKYTFSGYSELTKRMLTKDMDELYKVGVLDDNIIQDRTFSAVKSLKEKGENALWSMFDLAEKINRGSAYFGAKKKFLAEGMDEQSAIQAAKQIVRDTQFTFGSVDTPVAMGSDLTKILTQFQSFNVKQAEFLGGMIKEKDVAGMARYIAGTLAMVGSVGKLVGYDAKDAIPFSDLLTGEGRFLSPAVETAKAIPGAIVGDEETKRESIDTLKKNAVLAIPAGAQIRKTLQGATSALKGYSETDSGDVRFPVSGTSDKIRAGVFGQYSLPQAQKYVDSGFKRLQGQKSAIFKSMVKDGVDANAAFEQAEKERLIASAKTQIKNGYNIDIEGLSQNEIDFVRAEHVISEMNSIKKADKQGRANRLAELRQSGFITPETEVQIKALMSAEERGATKSDRELIFYSPEYRARKIKDRIDGLDSKDKKREKLDLYRSMGIIDDQVQQIILSLQ